jgi:hypothetical protein
MNSFDIDKAYISEYDIFFAQFDKTHEKSLSQQKEIQKHKKIAEKRDNVMNQDKKGIIWEAF